MTTPSPPPRARDRAAFHPGRLSHPGWLARQDVQTIAETIGPDFRDIDRGLLERAIERFKKQDTWGVNLCSDVRSTTAEFGKPVAHQEDHRYEDLVDTAIADGPVREVSGG